MIDQYLGHILGCNHNFCLHQLQYYWDISYKQMHLSTPHIMRDMRLLIRLEDKIQVLPICRFHLHMSHNLKQMTDLPEYTFQPLFE